MSSYNRWICILVLGFLGFKSSALANVMADLAPVLSANIAEQLEQQTPEQAEAYLSDHADRLEQYRLEMIQQGFSFSPETERALFQLADKIRESQKKPFFLLRALGAVWRFIKGGGKTIVRGTAIIGNLAFDVVATPVFFGIGIADGLGIRPNLEHFNKETFFYGLVGIGPEIIVLTSSFLIINEAWGVWAAAGMTVGMVAIPLTLKYWIYFKECFGLNRINKGRGHELFCDITTKMDTAFAAVSHRPGKWIGKSIKWSAKQISSLFKNTNESEASSR